MVVSLLVPLGMTAAPKDYTKYVDPFIGADGGGYAFCGACVPFGMVKLGPDCNNLTENAGWQKDTDIVGFSHTHLNGQVAVASTAMCCSWPPQVNSIRMTTPPHIPAKGPKLGCSQ